MKNTLHNRIRREFTVTPNALIQDSERTPQARFLYTYMASKPDDWVFYSEYLMSNTGWSDETLSKYLKELLDSGWLSRTERRVGGMFAGWDYTLHEVPTVPEKNRAGILPGRKKSDHTKKETPSLKRIEEISWDADPEKRISEAYRVIAEKLKETPRRWKELAQEARNPLNAEQFKVELKDWLRHNADTQQIICNPVKSLTSGPGNFLGWLNKPWCLDKYTEKPQGRTRERTAGEAPVIKYQPPKARV